MAKVSVPGIHAVHSKGRVYTYAWRGGPRIHSEPGTTAFIQEVAQLTAERKTGDPTRVSGLCIEWRASAAWTRTPAEGGLAESTKKNWRRWVDEIQTHFGSLRLKQFDRPAIRQDIKRWRNKWRDTPRAADMAKQVLSALLSYAVEEGRLSSNPCFGISNLYASDRSEIIWGSEDLARVGAKASPEIMWALKLACLTGLRRADLLRLSWSHVGELAIEISTGKSGQKKTAVVPLYGELRELLAEIPRRSPVILTNTEHHPWKSGFSSSWNKAMIAAGEKTLHFHDARGTFATKAYLAGFSIREIAEMLTWAEDKVERIINRYVKKNALLQDRIRRMDEARKTPAENGG